MKAAEWIAALRSGEYKQGRAFLCNKGHFCCLGVLADISGVPKREGYEPEAYMFELSGSVAATCSMIPVSLWPTFLEDLDLSMVVPKTDLYDWGPLHNRLAAMNDGGHTFSEIADYIEEVYNANK